MLWHHDKNLESQDNCSCTMRGTMKEIWRKKRANQTYADIKRKLK